MVLARRIFEIMEGPGLVTHIIDSRRDVTHPGTINFGKRLSDAKRIHNENMAIAARLDAIQPYYDTSYKRLSAVSKKPKGNDKISLKQNKKNKTHIPGSRTDYSPTKGKLFSMEKKSVMSHDDEDILKGSTTGKKKPRNVLLEYTKIQNGRVLDVAVIKEPFRDCYSIFGIDIDDGQRYELRLTSEEVANILEGDILVTSVDNVEVWMVLLTKVELYPVSAFSKLPLHLSAENSEVTSRNKESAYVIDKEDFSLTIESNKVNGATLLEQNSISSSMLAHNSNFPTISDSEKPERVVDDANIPRGDSAKDALEGYTLDEYYDEGSPLIPFVPKATSESFGDLTPAEQSVVEGTGDVVNAQSDQNDMSSSEGNKDNSNIDQKKVALIKLAPKEPSHKKGGGSLSSSNPYRSTAVTGSNKTKSIRYASNGPTSPNSNVAPSHEANTKPTSKATAPAATKNDSTSLKGGGGLPGISNGPPSVSEPLVPQKPSSSKSSKTTSNRKVVSAVPLKSTIKEPSLSIQVDGKKDEASKSPASTAADEEGGMGVAEIKETRVKSAATNDTAVKKPVERVVENDIEALNTTLVKECNSLALIISESSIQSALQHISSQIKDRSD